MRLDRIGAYTGSPRGDDEDNKPRRGKKVHGDKKVKKPRRPTATPRAAGLFPPPAWQVTDGWARSAPPRGLFVATGDALSTNIRIGASEKSAIDSLVGAMTARAGRRATQPIAIRALVAYAAQRPEAFWTFCDSAT